MKHLLLSALIIACAFCTSAQTEQKNTANDREAKRAELNEKLLNAKLEVLIKKLDITDAQKAQFTAIYTKYDNEVRATMSHQRPAKSDDVKVVAEQLKSRLDQSKKAIDVQKKYVDEFAKVLNARQLSKFLFTEKQIQNKLNKRKHERHGDRGGKGGFDDRGHKGHKGPKGHKRPTPQEAIDD